MTGMMGLTSCDDFLTITPTSSIVEEDFWKDKKDLENVVYACYTRLTQSDIMEKIIQWGEMRSDNFELRTGVTSTHIRNLMNANLLPTNPMFKWEAFYNEINYCNKVLAHGPEIVETDESFSNSDWQPIRAEMLTLRALCHFYLVRTFERIPYVTVDYNNDNQEFLIGQSEQIEVLDSIIKDLEIAKDLAMNSYGNTVETKGRITKKAIYTLLADVYLWRGSYKEGNDTINGAGKAAAASDYTRCVECCDWVIDRMKTDYLKSLNQDGLVLGGLTEIELTDLFVQNAEEAYKARVMSNSTAAYTSIFGSGNSRESIFELQFDGTNNSNGMLTSLFYNVTRGSEGPGQLVCTPDRFSGTSQDCNVNAGLLYARTDYRRWETLLKSTTSTSTDCVFTKFHKTRVTQSNANANPAGLMNDNNAETTANAANRLTISSAMRTTPLTSNWIFYRLSDVVLMKAEALAQLYSDKEHLTEAYNLVREVYKRSNPYPYITTTSSATIDTLKMSSEPTSDEISDLVLLERQREFVGEGKRWFDLVRLAQRKGRTTEMLKLLEVKYDSGKKDAIKSKLSPMKALFSPIYTSEMKSNKLLQQNPVWKTTDSTSKTDEL